MEHVAGRAHVAGDSEIPAPLRPLGAKVPEEDEVLGNARFLEVRRRDVRPSINLRGVNDSPPAMALVTGNGMAAKEAKTIATMFFLIALEFDDPFIGRAFL